MDTTIVESVAADELVEEIKTGVLQQQLESLIPKFWSFFWSAIIALVVFFIGTRVIKGIIKVFHKAMNIKDIDPGVETFLESVLRWILYIILITIILGLFGITTTSISAAVAGLGVTIGLALQGSLSNFAGGVLILVSKPFKVGDYICDKGSNTEGFVLKIDLLYTNLRTYDNKMITIPNGTLADSTIVNYTALGNIRVSVKTDIAYGADIKKAKEVLLKAADKHEAVMKNRPVTVSVTELGSSGVKLELRVWAANLDDYWKILFDLTEDVKLSLDEAGIEIPFNQVTVHMAED